MDTTKFTMGIVGLVVIILMVTGAVIPAVEDAQHAQTTTENNVTEKFMATYAESGEVINISKAADTPLDINGEKVSVISFRLCIIADSFTVFFDNVASGWITLYSETLVNVSNSSRITSLVLSDGVMTYTSYNDPETTGTIEYTWCFYPSNDGDYGVFGADMDLFVDKGQTVYVGGRSGNARCVGTLTDAVYTSLWMVDQISNTLYPPDEGTVDFNLTYQSTDYGYNYTAATLSAAFTVSDATTTITFDQSDSQLLFVAPIEYTVQDAKGSISVLFGLIPLLLIIVAVLYAVRLMGTSRN